MIADSVPATYGMSVRLRVRFVATAIAAYIDENERPEEQRARLASPERRELVRDRKVRARERRDVLEREIVRDERDDEAGGGEHDARERRVDRALAAGDEIVAMRASAGERHDRAPGRHEKRDPERQLADENHGFVRATGPGGEAV